MPTYTQGQQFINPQGVAQGAIQFNPNNGQPLNVGQTVQFSPTISTDVLNGNGQMPNMPSVTPTLTPQQFVAGLSPIQPTITNAVNPTSVSGTTGNVNKLEGARGSLYGRLSAAQQELLGQGQAQLQLEQQAGIPQSVKEINALNEQIIGLKAQFDAKAGATATNTFGVESQDTRINAINRQSAIQIGGLSAFLMAKQGSLEAAKAEVDRVLKFEFDPIRQEIENTKTFLELNSQDLSRADQKQATALQAQLAQQARDVDYFRDVKKMYLENALKTGNTAQMNAITSARSLADLSKINTDLAQSTIPSERVEGLQGTLTLLNQIKDSSGLNTRVGPTSLARRFAAFGDAFGAGDAFAGSVQQLTSQQTLDALINLKAQGGTLGALSEGERAALQAAATKIAAWERKDNNGVGKGTWDVSEKTFKAELDRLTNLTNTALLRAGVSPVQLAPTDYQDIQNVYNMTPGQFNASAYFN